MTKEAKTQETETKHPKKITKEENVHETETKHPAKKTAKEEKKHESEKHPTKKHETETKHTQETKTEHTPHIATRGHKEETPKKKETEEKGTFHATDGSKWKVEKINKKDDELSTVLCTLCDRSMKRKSIKTHVNTLVHKKNRG